MQSVDVYGDQLMRLVNTSDSKEIVKETLGKSMFCALRFLRKKEWTYITVIYILLLPNTAVTVMAYRAVT